MLLLDVQNYTKRFAIHHLGREIAVFQNITFALREGQFILVAGPNGAGKSTLLRCLYRTCLPTAGSAYYHSQSGVIDLASAADVDITYLRAAEIGFVTQFLRPRPRVSALELVAEPLVAAGEAWDTAMQRAGEMLTMFDLKSGLWQAYPTTFSGGEQQKVNLARALIHTHRLLLLDEPTASLDAATRAALTARLAELKRQGVAMIGIFHHPEDVAALVEDRIEIGPASEEDYSAETLE
ncbi:MAG TPA: ATP-binding cassette domain-containing protein [Aggregatilineales bacterium]|nr:ATP-binding cassette domain-containing protein [Aggregatilineales bacterium]